MNTRIRELLLVPLCIISILLVATGFRECSPEKRTKAARLILAFEAAQALPAAFGVTGDQAQLVSDGFGTLAAAARALREGKGTWESFTQTFEEVRARPSWRRLDEKLRARADAVWVIAARIVDSLSPAGGARAAGSRAPKEKPDLDRVGEADLRELERLVGRRK